MSEVKKTRKRVVRSQDLGRFKEPWYDTAIDLSKVLSQDEEGHILLAGKAITDAQLVQLKSDASLMERLPLWPVVIETMRQYAVDVGFNKSLDFEAVKVAKAMLLILETQKQWTRIIASSKPFIKKT
jgi:hypothetical protein